LLGVGTKVVPCEDAGALLAQYDRVASHDPRLIVQEVVPGGDERLVYVCVYFGREGACLGAFAGRKPRVLPPGMGSASYAFTFHDPTLIDAARRLCEGVGYRGLGGIEFKLDPRDNTYKLIEFNVRFGLWDALGARYGVNLALLAWRDAQGLPVEPAFACREGASWCSFQRDLSAFKLYRRQGTLGLGAWLRSLLAVDMWAVFAWDDPKPWLTETPGYVWSRIAPRIGLGKGK
jgi:predicted ATP-grasp superfamily ATP-dependent carboligase